LIQPRLNLDVTAVEMDRQVSELIARGESIYLVDAELLKSLSPDLIVTQDLCHVCTASPDDLGAALARFSKPPRVLSLTPHTLADVWKDIRRVGEVTHRPREAQSLAIALEQRIGAIEAKCARAASRPRVLCLEWLAPYYVGGHWVPEMVAKAGGDDVLGHCGEPSFRVSAEQIADSHADVIVVTPCGYGKDRVAAECHIEDFPASLKCLPAVRERRIFAVDANSYFSRPGPRLADGVALLAHLLHPDLYPTAAPANSYCKL
jgi:iron complex transport system substrate-binding protein